MTTEQKAAVHLVLAAIGDAIHEAGVQGIPSGHLYAVLMGRMSLEVYTQFIDALKVQGKVKESGHLLTWIGGQ